MTDLNSSHALTRDQILHAADRARTITTQCTHTHCQLCRPY